MAQNYSLLFIPDISGFTQFVNETAIAHSQHIIRELLELIIESNELGMEVAEVEGDAVFFYKYKSVPRLEEICRQAENIFIKFHRHLAQYETNRICECGACTTASNLSLKFVAHVGDFDFIEIKGKKKPYGPDVILVHRLLKNDINASEYLLISEGLLDKIKLADEPIPGFDMGSSHYSNFGEVSYAYQGLSDIRDNMAFSNPEPIGTYNRRPLEFDIFINKPRELVYEIVSNFDFRHEWNPDVDYFEYEKGKVNRIGTKHFCVIGNNKIEFETVSHDFGKDKQVYGEKIARFPLVKEFTSYYILEESEGGTRLSIQVHFKPWPILGWLLLGYFKKTIRKNFKKNLDLIKEASEKKLLVSYD